MAKVALIYLPAGEGFLLSEGITFADIELSSEDGQIGAELPEPWRSKWSGYHRKHARLRMLPRELNSKIGARDPAEVLRGRDA